MVAGRPQARGNCAYCGQSLTRTGMARHLRSCPERARVIEAADARGGAPLPIFHIVCQDAEDGAYWLHLEMNGTTTIGKLDEYLRTIWLECCGHLSHFSPWEDPWAGYYVPKSWKARRALVAGHDLMHVYDYGSSTYTKIRVLGAREGRPVSSRAINLMARNNPPLIPCQECGEPASWLCHECDFETDQPGTLCDAHAAVHPHEDYGPPVPLVNSPRTGVCGYVGPAETPR